MTTASTTADREIVITRVFDVPRHIVFSAWSDPQHIGNWWGPSGFSTTTHTMDFRPGGTWRFVMHGPDGRDYLNRIVYDEIIPPARLVYHHDGDEGSEDVRFQTFVTFEDDSGRTRLTLRMVFPSAAERDRVAREYGAVEGGQQTLSRLAAYLAS